MTKIKYCPHCKTARIKLFLGAETGVQYKCEKCGYQGPLFIEKEVNDKK